MVYITSNSRHGCLSRLQAEGIAPIFSMSGYSDSHVCWPKWDPYTHITHISHVGAINIINFDNCFGFCFFAFRLITGLGVSSCRHRRRAHWGPVMGPMSIGARAVETHLKKTRLFKKPKKPEKLGF